MTTRAPIRSTSSRVKLALHVIGAAVVWILFAWAWVVVFLRRTSEQAGNGLLVLGAFLVLMLLVTLGWVRHNVRLHAKRGPRVDIPTVREDWAHDVLGREVEADWAQVRGASMVIVVQDDTSKRYTPRDADQMLELLDRA